jgi:phage tail sheath protein FI
MPPFLHGPEVIELDTGTRPIRTVTLSVIGLVGTAPDADAAKFPLNTPVLIAGSAAEAAGLDTVGDGEGSLPGAVAGIFDQIGAMIVVVRVEDDATPATEQTNVIGANTTPRTGIGALLDAESVLGVRPRILIAPGFSEIQAVAAELEVAAAKLRAMAVIDGPNTDDAAAIAYGANFGGRCYEIDPQVLVGVTPTAEPASARVAGLISRIDNEKGFWHSPSNNQIYGIVGTDRPIDFALGDSSARANYLNENNVATIINQNGFRLWGNRTLSGDAKWAFLSVRRTADAINDSILAAHLWAIDRNITKTYFEEVIAGVKAFLRNLEAQGAILGGHDVWADPDLNTPESIANGQVYIDFSFTPPYPAERLTFRSLLTNDGLEDIVPST